MRQFLIFISLFLSTHSFYGQDNAVLFYLEDNPVTVSEFKYIYEKNNRDQADYSKESLEEYLDLYINFKLKVQKAKDLGYHESDVYKEELAGYRSQLADSYIIDREVIRKLADQIYERSQADLELQHILIALDRKSDQEKEKEALSKIQTVYDLIQKGMTFEEAVLQFSQDRGSVSLNGNIGFINAPLPDGYVALEQVAYSLEVGELSEPVRSDLGYHLVKLVSKRPARGKMEAQHILIRNSRNGIRLADAGPRANRIYDQIMAGTLSFEEACVKFSEDRETKSKMGNLGVFGIGEYERSFEDGAFELMEDGAISEPVLTSIGWHIIKRVRKIEPPSSALLFEQLKSKPKAGVRFDFEKRQVVERIKKEAKFSDNPELLDQFANGLSEDFFSYSWQPSELEDDVLANFGNRKYSLEEFADFAKTNVRERMKAKGTKEIKATVDDLYEQFVNDMAIAFAEQSLEERYPEFNNLMREYREGILLFDITKDLIWDKAGQDTSAVKSFYEANKHRYNWKERVQVTHYTLRTIEPTLVTSILNGSRNKDPEGLTKLFNKQNELIVYKEETLDTDHSSLEGITLKEGFVSTPRFDNKLNVTQFTKIEKTFPPRPKTLREARGYVISDYQDQMDKNWVEELKKEYNIKLQKKTFKKLVKKT